MRSIRSVGTGVVFLFAAACSSASPERVTSNVSPMRLCTAIEGLGDDAGACSCTSLDVPGPSDANAFQRCFHDTVLDFDLDGTHYGPEDALSLLVNQATPSDVRLVGGGADEGCPAYRLRPYDLDAPVRYPGDDALHARPATVEGNWQSVLYHYAEGRDETGAKAFTSPQARTGALLWIEETRQRPGWELVATFFRELASRGGFAVDMSDEQERVATEIVRRAALAGCDVPPADTTLGRGYTIAVANGAPSPSDAKELFAEFGPVHDPVNFFPGHDGVVVRDAEGNEATVAVGPFDPGSPCGATCRTQ
jgi:hypothetical protein